MPAAHEPNLEESERSTKPAHRENRIYKPQNWIQTQVVDDACFTSYVSAIPLKGLYPPDDGCD